MAQQAQFKGPKIVWAQQTDSSAAYEVVKHDPSLGVGACYSAPEPAVAFIGIDQYTSRDEDDSSSGGSSSTRDESHLLIYDDAPKLVQDRSCDTCSGVSSSTAARRRVTAAMVARAKSTHRGD
jgi:hypothetical protein